MIDNLQARVAEVHKALFHDDPTDVPERACRFLEEAVELFQAFDLRREDAHALVDYVFDRPVGMVSDEVGGTMMTLLSLCEVAGIRLNFATVFALEKFESPAKIAKIRAKRKTRHGRFPLPGVDPEGT